MHFRQPLAVLVAGLISLPLVALALAGAGYIAYSLLAESWYRDTFAAYGVKLLLLYTFFAIGVAGAAAFALRLWPRYGRAGRIWLFGAGLCGVVAAALLELQFWSNVEDFLPHGLLLLPFVGWAIVALRARHAA